jgi:outer membrane receptor protein involved in Fe transport
VTRNERFTQELRAILPLGSRVQWLIGGFYANEDSEFGQTVLAASPSTGQVAGTFYTFLRPYDYTDKAVFTNFTVQLTDTFDVQIGGRFSRFWQAQGPTPSLGFPPLGTGAPVLAARVIGEPDTAFTYLLTPRWRPSEDVMVYARLASGYRPGMGGSSSPADPCRVNNYPCQYGPDRTLNYEVGAKVRAFGGLVSFDASAFHIDWQDMQLTVLHAPSGRTFVSNASRARSRGVEGAVEIYPRAGLTIAASVALTDAELAEPLPTGSASLPVGGEGDRLPLSARFSGSLSVDQQFNLAGDVTASVGATFSRVGERPGIFTPASAPRLQYPAYSKVDLRAGIQRGTWELDAFVNNLTDERGVIARGTIPSLNVTYVPPRTIGMSVVKTF